MALASPSCDAAVSELAATSSQLQNTGMTQKPLASLEQILRRPVPCRGSTPAAEGGRNEQSSSRSVTVTSSAGSSGSAKGSDAGAEDMTPIHKLINTADRNLNKKGPKTARQNESKQKANFDPKAENLKAMMTKQKILNAPKQGKFRELANIYAKAIRSLVKVMYRASATQDAGALNVSRVYDFVQQVKEAIGTNYVTGGVDPEKCDCDEVFKIAFSREKDTRPHTSHHTVTKAKIGGSQTHA